MGDEGYVGVGERLCGFTVVLGESGGYALIVQDTYNQVRT